MCVIACSLKGLHVPISCKLRVLHAKVNLKRAEQGRPSLSLRRLADESGVSLSVVAALNTGQSQRIDYATIDRLLNYFSGYFRVTTSDLLVWEPGTAALQETERQEREESVWNAAVDGASALGQHESRDTWQ